jgi:LacI family transcriptional regulator, gluconate utilization system Gnt-I transcriptional repressor
LQSQEIFAYDSVIKVFQVIGCLAMLSTTHSFEANMASSRAKSKSQAVSNPNSSVVEAKRITIVDVALTAGVGTMTVSRALNHPEMVSSELRKRVLKAVEKLGYIPNRVAGGLASGTAKAIPVIVPTLNHPVYVPFLEGLYSLLPQAGYQILLGTNEYQLEAEEKLIATLLGWQPDAIVIAGVDHSLRTRNMLIQARVPVVEIMDLTDQPIDMNIGFSHEQVGVVTANFLVDKGYQHIAYAGMLNQLDLRGARRMKSFLATLKRRKMPHHYLMTSDQASSISVGQGLMIALLEKHPDIDAVFFANDDLAAGALFECQRRKIRVPKDIAIIGFNDSEIASQVNPGLTTVATPRYEMGRLAADMLLRRLRGTRVDSHQIDIGFRIVEREST